MDEFTEAVDALADDKNSRPDGLIVDFSKHVGALRVRISHI